MKTCLKRFIGSAAGYHHAVSRKDGKRLEFGAESDLLAFCGHNGLMDVQDLDVSKALEKGEPHQEQDVAILACESKSYFEPYFEKLPQTPLIWTSGLMSPEAYTLDRIIEEWQEASTRKDIRKAAAKTYDEYQDCGLKAAERLFLCSD